MQKRKVGVLLTVLALCLLAADARRSYSSKSSSGLPPVPKDRADQQIYPSRTFSPSEEGADLYHNGYPDSRGSEGRRGSTGTTSGAGGGNSKKGGRGRSKAYYDDDNEGDSNVVETFTASTSGKATVALASGKHISLSLTVSVFLSPLTYNTPFY